MPLEMPERLPATGGVAKLGIELLRFYALRFHEVGFIRAEPALESR